MRATLAQIDTLAGAALDLSSQRRLEQLFESFQPQLYRLARRLSKDGETARDLVQETFFRAARKLGSVPQGGAAEEAWLVRTMVNLCHDRYRRRVVRTKAEPLLQAVPTAALGDPEAPAVARATLQTALAKLPPKRRAVIVLHLLEDVPVQEIARLLGITRPTVRWHLSVALRTMARFLLEK